MTRLTDAQIDEVWYATPNLRGFVDRIAALAVQEVERERVGVNWEANFLSERHFRKDAEAKVATLTAQLAERDASSKANEGSLIRAIEHERSRAERAEAQLAEAQESLLAAHKQLRSFGVEPKPPLGFAPNGHAGSRSWFEAALAEVTKERDAHREQSRINDEVALCYRRDWQQAKAQLATAKREGWYEVAQYIQGQSHHPHPTDFGVATSIRAEAENRYPYPATPSGELCDADCGCKAPSGAAKWDISEPRNPATPQHTTYPTGAFAATPSPEAREVPFPARFLVLDHDGKCIGYVPMGCTEARQVVAMGMDLTPTSQLAAMTQGVK
jgi:hypothetical protein